MDDLNRVARQMVDAEPSTGLEVRIRARLDGASPVRARGGWGTWQIAAGLCATAALVTFAVLGFWGSGVLGSWGPVVPGSGGLPAIAQRAAAGREVLASDISPFRTLPPLRHYTDTQRAQSSALSVEELAWMDRRVPALDPVVALEMEQLAMKSIQPEPLAITPLIMTALPTDGGTTERPYER